MEKFSTKKLVYLSLLISLNIILARVASIKFLGGRIGFGGFPIIFAGITMGPVSGGIVGAVGDIVGYNIGPMGPYMPHFTLTAALTGIIPGIVIRLFKKSKNGYELWQLLIAIGLGQLITSIILVPYFMQVIFNLPMLPRLPRKIIGQLIHVPLYSFLIKAIMDRIPVALKSALYDN